MRRFLLPWPSLALFLILSTGVGTSVQAVPEVFGLIHPFFYQALAFDASIHLFAVNS